MLRDKFDGRRSKLGEKCGEDVRHWSMVDTEPKQHIAKDGLNGGKAEPNKNPRGLDVIFVFRQQSD